MALSIIGEFMQRSLQMAWIWAVLVPLEVLWPRGGQVALLPRLRAATFAVVYQAISAALMVVIFLALKASGVRPVFAVDLRSATPIGHAASILAGTTISVLLYDFLYYWFHRAQHVWLWRFHAMHHAIEDVGAINYGHWTEELMRIPFITLPLALFTPSGLQVLPWAFALVTLQSQYVHSQTRLHVGPLWRLMMDNRFHRIHHSIEPKHHDHNFGVLTPVWDWLFGTLYVPAPGEWPATGVRDEPEAASIHDFLWRPFRAGGRTAAATTARIA